MFLWHGKESTEAFCFYNKTCRSNIYAHIILPKINRKKMGMEMYPLNMSLEFSSILGIVAGGYGVLV